MKNSTLFYAILCTLTFASFPAFVATLIHALRGNRNKVPILASIAILIDESLYACYIYEYSQGRGNKLKGCIFYMLSISLFGQLHWYISYLYYECASVNPFVKTSKRQKRKIQKQIHS